MSSIGKAKLKFKNCWFVNDVLQNSSKNFAEAKRIMDLENGPESYPFYLSAIRMGDLCFAGIGGEPFTELGNRILEGSPHPATLLCCLPNNGGGYIPNRKAYEEGGYEARSSHLAPGGDDIIVEGTINLLKKL